MVNLREAVMTLMAVIAKMMNMAQTAVMAVIMVAVLIAVVAPIRNAGGPIKESGEVQPALPCFESCMCKFINGSPAVDVQCGDQNLSSVPKIADNIPVSVLNLSFNALNNLTLDGYQSAKKLYLRNCQLKSIDEEAFNGFKNLMVVDLSNNLLTSIPPRVFADNPVLDRLILRNNDLQDIDPNTPILNGPASLSSLDLQSCGLSTLSSATFSSLPNLRYLDISRNKLVFLDSECLYSLRKLEDINVESNPWKCGAKFVDLLCWMQRKLVASRNRTLDCQHDNETWEIWTTFCCGSYTNASLIQDSMSDATDTTTVNQQVSCSQETGNSFFPPPWSVIVVFIVGVFVGVIVSGACAYYVHRKNRSLRDNQIQHSVTWTGPTGSVKNSQEAEGDGGGDDANQALLRTNSV
jgi:hypothetical protein